jgi:outer membrane receptor protein involved in Fe transport
VVSKRIPEAGLTYNALYSRNDETGRRLPQTPANKGRLHLRLHTQRLKSLHNPYLGLEAECVGRGYVSGPDEPFGTPTDSYSLIRLNTGFAWKNQRDREFSFRFQINNLLDETYRDFLYPYKSWAANPGRNLVVSIGYHF